MLRDLQQRFMVSLLLDSKFSPIDPLLLNKIQVKNIASLKQGFRVYQHNHSLGLIKALSMIYPVCQQLVGDDFFRQMAKMYIEAHPSEFYNLNHYGHTFSAFIKAFPYANSLPFLAEVAGLEWLIHKNFTAENSVPFDLAAYAKLPEDAQTSAVLALQPNGFLFEAAFPVDKIWEAHQKNAEYCLQENMQENMQKNINSETGVEEERWNNIDLNEGKIYLFIWRKNFNLRLDRLSQDEIQVLQKIQAGARIQDLAEDPKTLSLIPVFIQRGYVGRHRSFVKSP